MNVLDLFSGIGGIALGLERAGMRTVAFCEIDPFCRIVLAERFPGIPIYDDVRTLNADRLARDGIERIDLIAGGFPCQDASVAGTRRGIAGERTGLWTEFARLVSELRPPWVLAENVAGLRTSGADRVLSDLEAFDYTAWPLVVGADDVGAPHRRKRVWIVAHRNGWRCEGIGFTESAGVEGASGYEPDGRATALEHASGSGREERHLAGLAGDSRHTAGRHHTWPAGPGEPQYPWEPPRVIARTEPGVGLGIDGLPARLAVRVRREALRALGNSVVPQVVEGIGRAIMRCTQ